MTLREWAEAEGLSDREIAEKMTEWLRANHDAEAPEVSVPAVQKYRSGRPPKGERMAAVYAVTEGWVSANDFFDLPPVPVIH